jgi:glycerol-3-phosphate dehydrogenase
VKLEDIYQSLIEKLKVSAIKIGANAIVGINFQVIPLSFDEQSKYQVLCNGSLVWAKPLSSEIRTDYAIIGGGIVGAGIFRDLALHAMSVTLFDKGDFSSQTSQSSSKMLHGGIRYLENMDFALVHEALEEKNIWLRLAPHLVQEKSFHMPVFDNTKYPLFAVKIALMLYDTLSRFRNTPHRTLSKSDSLSKFPMMQEKGLKGCGIYYDAVVDDVKLTLECIYDGLLEENAHAYNYYELISIEKKSTLYHLIFLDQRTQSKINVQAKHVIFATGPFTDKLMHQMNIPWENQLVLSKGSHLWIKKSALPITDPIVLQTKDNRVIFVIPQEDAVLVGTTEKTLAPSAEIWNIQADADEIEYLLQQLHHYFPHAKITNNEILSTFAGIRPLVKDPNCNDPHKTSRTHQVYTPQANMHVIMGGKYTTFRKMAAELTATLMNQRQLPYYSQKTLSPLRRHSVLNKIHSTVLSEEILSKIHKNEMVFTYEDLLRRLSLNSENHLDLDKDNSQAKLLASWKSKLSL